MSAVIATRPELPAIVTAMTTVLSIGYSWPGYSCFRGSSETCKDFSRNRNALRSAIIDREAPETIFAIGDIHGDYQRLVQLLIAAKIVPAAPAEPEQVASAASRAVSR